MTTENVEEEQAAELPDVSRHSDCVLLVKDYTMMSLAPAIIPLPILDLVALSSIQLKMLHTLSGKFEVEFSKKIAKAAMASLVSSVLPVAAAPLLGSMVKIIPGLGQVSGVASMLVLSGASTHALGMVFIRHFEMGGDLTNFDAQSAKGYFTEEFEKGKKVVNSLRKSAEEASPTL